MRPRIFIAHALIRAGSFIKSLPIVVMRPDDLVAFSRETYSRNKSIHAWDEKELVDSGLDPIEMDLLEMIPSKTGKLLLLGVGGGREAIPLAGMGFEVTGVDFVPEILKKAKQNATERGLSIRGLVQEISNLDVPSGSHDVAWLSSGMYSCVPTRNRRVQMLKRIRDALIPGGHFLCQFHWDPESRPSFRGRVARQIFALLTLGNFWYEPGDMLWGNGEFIHTFSSENKVRSEFEEAGFQVVHIRLPQRGIRAGALLRSA